MSTPPAGAQRAHPLARALGWPVLILLVGAVLGYWATASSGHEDHASAGVDVAAEHDGDHDYAETRSNDTQSASVTLPKTASPTEFTELTGLEVLRIGITGSGGLLDLRYRAVDDQTANAYADQHPGSAIIDVKTGTPLTAQWMGHAHPPTSYQPDRNYWMLFQNPNGLVRSGDLVSIHLGPAVLTGVRVG